MRAVIIIILIAAIIFIVSMMLTDDRENGEGASAEEARVVAEGYMENEAPTYVHDGSGLELVSETSVDESTFEFTFEFESSAAGYGDRSDEMAAQVITEHTTVVTVEDGEVTSAVTDEVFSELDGEMLEGEEEEGTTVSLYFTTVTDGEESVEEVERTVAAGEGVEQVALEALLAGPSEEEEEEGFGTALNSDVSINSFEIEDGVATVDFSSELDAEVAGSAMVMAIREQIESTLLQFDSIDEVVISVEGETEAVLQP